MLPTGFFTWCSVSKDVSVRCMLILFFVALHDMLVSSASFCLLYMLRISYAQGLQGCHIVLRGLVMLVCGSRLLELGHHGVLFVHQVVVGLPDNEHHLVHLDEIISLYAVAITGPVLLCKIWIHRRIWLL